MTKSIKRKFLSFLNLLILFILFCCLYGCGNTESAGTDTGTNTTTTDLSSLALSLTTEPGGISTAAVSTGHPTRLTATAIDKDGNPIAGRVITFTQTVADMVTFNPASAALTNGSGVASVILNAGSTPGATEINAAITTAAGSTLTSSVGIAVATASLGLSALTITPAPPAELSAGGTAEVKVTVLDSDGVTPYPSSVPVAFTSSCVQSGKATITSTVYTVSGIASATYRDINCASIDQITATLSGTTISSSGNIIVGAASAGSIFFVSATPNNISLRGTGETTQSKVLFRVLDTNGNPIQKQVNFSLDTTVGDITLSTINPQLSDPTTGNVQTIVYAGTVPTPVRVAAVINGTTLTSTSDKLTISTGIPTQNAVSLSATTLNLEGWDYNDTTSVIVARLSDRFLNPVPNGTVVNFRASGGSIEASCQTGVATTAYTSPAAGACGVYFTSSSPKPYIGQPGAQPANDGRVVVMAYALGEESFVDSISNGKYDLTETFTDMPEPYLDANENNSYASPEIFIDTNNDKLYSVADTKFNGILRDASITGPTQIHVRRSIPLVLSGSYATIGFTPVTVALSSCTNGVAFTNTPATVDVSVHDVNGNIMPAGTTISFAASNGKITSPTSFIVPNTSDILADTIYSVTLQSDATQGAGPDYICTNSSTSGSLQVTVTTPLGTTSYDSITVTD
ncbi:MAG: hypothetical protein NTW65_08360 [Deltaproteobacteria bacterium]|nr:hypothetical protein [Deltaproteobacteria bacterium]